VVENASQFVERVIVVDNNSSDRTALIAKLTGAHVVPCKKRGMGRATSTGIIWAVALGAETIITLDGDGQHDPLEIPKLLRNLWLTGSDIATGVRVGVRLGNSPMPRYRRLGVQVITLAYNLGARDKLLDAQCGFRAFTVEVAMNIKTRENGFGCITEFLIKARKKGYKITGVPVTCIYHNSLKANSTMNPVKHGVSVLLSTIRWRIWEILNCARR